MFLLSVNNHYGTFNYIGNYKRVKNTSNTVLEIIFLYSQDICPFKSSFWSDI